MILSGYSRYAKTWAALWLALVVVCLILLLTGKNPVLDIWSPQYASTLGLLSLLVLAAPAMHALDQRSHGYGLSHVYHDTPITRYQLDDTIVSGLLTVLSVRAATAVVALGLLLNGAAALVIPVKPQALDWPSILASPRQVTFCVVLATLAWSVVTTMAALLCYDYSLRFDWKAKPRVRYALRKKAHRLGVLGFYSLMWSLAVATALIDLKVAIAAATLVFGVMWYYYFFNKDILGEDERREAISPTLPAQP